MHAFIQPLHAFASCDGMALVVGRAATTAPGDAEDVGLALAGILGEREAEGTPVRVVAVRLTRRDDAAWAATAVDWLGERGRRVLVRTSAVMSRRLEQAARRWGAVAMLELAHPDPAIQAALIGDGAEPAASLLLHAQHLRRIGIEVAVHVGPLLPVVHERRDDVLALLRHIAAADIHDLHLGVGRLTRARHEALRVVLPSAHATALLRAYDLDPTRRDPFASVPSDGRRLAPLAAAALYHSVRLEAEAEGLRLDHCGCPAQCHLDPGLVPEYTPLLTPDLFADAG